MNNAAPLSLAQDIRRTFPQGVRFGVIQACVPVFFLLEAILTSSTRSALFASPYDAPESYAYFVWHNPTSALLIFSYPHALLSLFVGSLPILATGGIDVFVGWQVARRTRSVRAGILACLWANPWFTFASILALILWDAHVQSLFASDFLLSSPALLATIILTLIVTLIPAAILSFLLGGLGGRLGLRNPPALPQATAPSDTPLPAAMAQLARQNNLGTLVTTHISEQPSWILATGIGTALLVTFLFILQRYILHISGGDIFVDLVTALVGIIATIYQVYKRRGQLVTVYQNGLVVPTTGHQVAAIRWEDIDPQQTHVEEKVIVLRTKSGFRIVLPSTYANFADLKVSIAYHMQMSNLRTASH